jgi:hypothetical protein
MSEPVSFNTDMLGVFKKASSGIKVSFGTNVSFGTKVPFGTKVCFGSKPGNTLTPAHSMDHGENGHPQFEAVLGRSAVFDTPGHTRGHITLYFPGAQAVFPGKNR